MTKNLFIAQADHTSATIPGMSRYSSGQSDKSLDKYQFPKDYFNIAEICYHFYRTDPIVSNTINKVLDIGFKDFALHRKQCTDEEYKVYSSINSTLVMNLRDLGLEYMLSGLVIPEVTWTTKQGSEIDPELPPNKEYKVPDVLWKRDPFSIRLRKTSIPDRVVVTVIPSEDDIYFIKNEGVYSDGIEDKETYELLKQQYSDYVRAVKAGKTEFKLDNPHLIRRNPLPDSPYPSPYLMPVLEPLEHKRNLRKMDYAIAARVITAIMQVKMGSDEFPITSEDDEAVMELRNQFKWRYTGSNFERLFQLFTNHTIDILWITPDTSALLDDSKYDSVNLDILFGLGFPRIMLTGETAKTGTSQAEFALMSPGETIKAVRNSVLSWPTELYREMKERNSFVNLPEPMFSELRLYDLAKLMEVADLVYQRGALSKKTLANVAGFNFEDVELPQRVLEQEWFEDADLPEYPLMPFDANPDESSDEDNDADDSNTT